MADPEDLDDTFITAFKINSKEQSKKKSRVELLESLGAPGQDILSHYQHLQKLADDLDDKVKKTLNEHEKDFFVAYRTHMYAVQKDFKQLKQKADEEETKTRRDAKVHSLEKELQWFMNEALRLDELCKKYKQELDVWKGKAEALDEDRHFLEDQIKTSKRHNGLLRGAVEKAQQAAYKALVHGPVVEEEELQVQQVVPQEQLAQELEQRYLQTIAQLKRRLKEERGQIAQLRQARSNPWAETSQLEEFFKASIHEVKEEMVSRMQKHRQNTLANPRGRGTASAKHISYADFTATDKRQVIQKLLSNEEVLVFLYGKLFPHKEAAETSDGALLPVVGSSTVSAAQA
jgi:hypothetical protein